jgi:predicted transcriptional regulator
MARQTSKVPTDAELEFLRQLWDCGPLTGNQLAEAVKPQREVSYQAVMTTLSIMEKKGYVTRKKESGRFVYRAKVTEIATSKRMLQDLVRKVFGGSASAAVLNLLETSNLSDQELAELRQKINSHASEKKS